jgi:hypothetical protein
MQKPTAKEDGKNPLGFGKGANVVLILNIAFLLFYSLAIYFSFKAYKEFKGVVEDHIGT